MKRGLEATERWSRWRDDLVADVDRRRLRNRTFSLLSNDCWAGAVYRRFGLPYSSPFAGLMVMAPDYLELIGDLPTHFDAALSFQRHSRHEAIERRRAAGSLPDGYPIGLMPSGVEIHFLHYDSTRAAEDKWRRRIERVDLDQLWVKFDGSKDLAGAAERQAFQALGFARKVMFVATAAHAADAGGVVVRHWCEDAVRLLRTASEAFDVVDWLNGGDGVPRRLRRLGLRGS